MKQASVITGSSSKKTIDLKNIILEIIIALLVILWIYTGLLKLLDYDETKFQMGRSPFIQHIAGLTAFAIPVFELIIAGLLIFKTTRFIGLLASFFLMVVFTGYIYAMLHYSYYVPCSCGGVLAALSWEDHLIFNALYSLLALIGIFLHNGVKR
ncbi:MauE/DoxX family redox-associated membrane protein [Chitinophaga cymbidii]|uniref:MauE/DoxX family redox-associated membrane protein n=1 Tax=Chitinophaga cymbidii TaxID=1096750 RepID=UPI0011BF950A|nr:MauE/DoxX family redox-associated membrane protein [Chitinophaga cymbidii]